MWSDTISSAGWGLIFGVGMSALGALQLVFPRLFVRSYQDNPTLPFWIDRLWFHRTQMRVRIVGTIQLLIGLAVLLLGR